MASELTAIKIENHDEADDNAVLKLEEETPHNSSILAPSFNGRLNISDFAYTPNISPRRSPRHGSPSNTVRSASASPLKRSLSQTSKPNLSASPSKKKRSRIAPAPASTYAHLPPLPDRLTTGLICVFIGLNPGISTSVTGHAYAHPSNLFWKLLHSSGCTTRRCRPEEDVELPRLFGLGNTNIVSRPTRNGGELTKKEMDDSVEVLEEKIRQCRPEAVAVVGKSIWESIWRVRNGRGMKKGEFRYGWQSETVRMGKVDGEDGWEGAKVFVACSTSGLAASLSPREKEAIWDELGSWVKQRRKDMGIKEGEDYIKGDS